MYTGFVMMFGDYFYSFAFLIQDTDYYNILPGCFFMMANYVVIAFPFLSLFDFNNNSIA
jgi:hypothetical protein